MLLLRSVLKLLLPRSPTNAAASRPCARNAWNFQKSTSCCILSFTISFSYDHLNRYTKTSYTFPSRYSIPYVTTNIHTHQTNICILSYNGPLPSDLKSKFLIAPVPVETRKTFKNIYMENKLKAELKSSRVSLVRQQELAVAIPRIPFFLFVIIKAGVKRSYIPVRPMSWRC